MIADVSRIDQGPRAIEEITGGKEGARGCFWDTQYKVYTDSPVSQAA